MKKIPLHTIIFFYLSLVPIVFYVIISGGTFSIFGVLIGIIYFFPKTIILTPVVVFMQISAIVNYIDAYKQVKSHNCELYNKNKIPLWTVKFFYFSVVMIVFFVIMCGLTLYEGADLKYVIFSPETLILAPVVVLSIRNYLKG